MAAKKTIASLPENWKEIIMQIGREGGMMVHYMNAMNLSAVTYYRFLEDYPEFAEVVEEAQRHSEEWWVAKAMEAFEGGKSKMFNQHLWGFIMKNRFSKHWRDKTEMDITSNGKEVNAAPIQIEIIKSQDK
jgi:hypothetical protein